MKLPVAMALGAIFLVGCSGAVRTPRFVPSGDSSTALDTTTGKLCLTYPFTDEDKTIIALRGKSEAEQRTALAGMDEEVKKRVLERIEMPQNLPLCSELRAGL